MKEKNAKDQIFQTLILIARPAAGKSEIIDYLSHLDQADRRAKFHIGRLKFIDDFPFLWRWFEEDDLLAGMGKPRLYTDEHGYFKFNYLWDLLIKMINLEYEKFAKSEENREDYTVVIEFSRGKEHGGYQHALPMLSPKILSTGAILYIDVPWEESLRKNRKRFNPDKPDSILEHSLPDDKLKRLYYECDFKELVSEEQGFLQVEKIKIPFAIFNNEEDLTTRRGNDFVNALQKDLASLWSLLSRS